MFTFDFITVNYFNTKFLEEAKEFVTGLHPKAGKKLLYNIRLAEKTNDPKLFKKLDDAIWEFRVRHVGLQIRLLAFWDKTDAGNTLVLATHGFLKKTDKIPGHEITRAQNIRKKYYEQKK